MLRNPDAWDIVALLCCSCMVLATLAGHTEEAAALLAFMIVCFGVGAYLERHP